MRKVLFIVCHDDEERYKNKEETTIETTVYARQPLFVQAEHKAAQAIHAKDRFGHSPLSDAVAAKHSACAQLMRDVLAGK